jgi:hypothetical protein
LNKSVGPFVIKILSIGDLTALISLSFLRIDSIIVFMLRKVFLIKILINSLPFWEKFGSVTPNWFNFSSKVKSFADSFTIWGG